MNNLEKEKINRILFKNEQKKIDEDKRKYPALNNQITDLNINNYFEFNNDSAIPSPKSISTSFLSDKETKFDLNNEDKIFKINYEVNSFFKDEHIPDLYTPFGKISGDKYTFKQNNLNKINNEDNYEPKIIQKKRLRYFNLDSDSDEPEIILNILPKIKKSKYKKNKTIFSKKNCHICLSTDHYDKTECPKFKRCLKCLKYGHWAKDCKEIIKNICKNCKISAHNKEDCLKYHEGINNEELLLIKKFGLKCSFCLNNSHLICPFSTREKYIINYKNENIEQNTEIIKDYSNILFCPICAGNHLKKNCPEIVKERINNNIKERSNNSFGEINKIKNNLKENEINYFETNNKHKKQNDFKYIKDKYYKEKNYNIHEKKHIDKYQIKNNNKRKWNLYDLYKRYKERKKTRLESK